MHSINKKELLKKIKQRVQEVAPGASIYLYGSRARGDQHAESDWDVLILIDAEVVSRELEKKITYPLYDLEFDSGEIISPMVYTRHAWHTKHKITPFYQHVMPEVMEI